MSSIHTVLELQLRVPADDVDLATDRLWLAGAQAIEEVERHEPDRKSVELRTVLADSEDESRNRLGHLPVDWELGFIRRALEQANTWRAYVQPVRVSERLVVVPAWQSWEPAEGSPLQVSIEPGAAFGLGDHPTTRLMLAELDGLINRDGGIAGASVLDVGTGTGVLAIVAAAAGASVTAIDTAPASIESAQANAERNRVSVDVSNTPIGECEGRFDLILANILAPILVDMAADLKRLVAPGGRLIVSGVLADRFDHVTAALAPMEIEHVRRLDGWAAVVLR